jgi:membrane protease YdiL (CAAX protease family)
MPVAPAPAFRADHRGFDPATGAWLPVGPAAHAEVPAAGPAPDAPKKGAGYVLWTILLWLDLAALAFATVAAVVAGATLLFAPESAAAEGLREQLEGGTAGDIALNSVLGLVAFGLIPLLWVLGTRREAVEGTRRFLHLHLHRRGTGPQARASTVLLGVALAIGLVVAVMVLISAYTLATEGPGALTEEQDPNPAVQGILENLSWPLAVLIAVCAGVGEEIFFRGFLQRYVGVWGQAALFGVAHATGGYLPQIVFAFGLGLLFGFLLKRGWSLWTFIVAHVLYDFILLALALLYPELG